MKIRISNVKRVLGWDSYAAQETVTTETQAVALIQLCQCQCFGVVLSRSASTLETRFRNYIFFISLYFYRASCIWYFKNYGHNYIINWHSTTVILLFKHFLIYGKFILLSHLCIMELVEAYWTILSLSWQQSKYKLYELLHIHIPVHKMSK